MRFQSLLSLHSYLPSSPLVNFDGYFNARRVSEELPLRLLNPHSHLLGSAANSYDKKKSVLRTRQGDQTIFPLGSALRI